MSKWMSVKDSIWLACAIDSEGSIYIGKSRNQSGKRFACLSVMVYNTNLPYIENANRIMGRLVTRYDWQKKPKKHNIGGRRKRQWKRCYKITANGIRAQEILRKVLPFLIIKREKAIQALSLRFRSRRENMIHWNHVRPDPKRGANGRFI